MCLTAPPPVCLIPQLQSTTSPSYQSCFSFRLHRRILFLLRHYTIHVVKPFRRVCSHMSLRIRWPRFVRGHVIQRPLLLGTTDQPRQESCTIVGTAMSGHCAVDGNAPDSIRGMTADCRKITFHECGTTDLTPERLAAFYSKVGGNYDPLFLETKPPALSFIYQSLGCFHSLQPLSNAFEAPTLPALLPSGFVRWQTIQILLDPDEHSTYLQNAVRMWDIRNPFGGYFPKTIPREAFPAEPDPDMIAWHEDVSRRLEYDYLKRNTPRGSPPNFGPYQHQYRPKHSAPKEEKALAKTRRSDRTVPHVRYVEPSDSPARGKSRKDNSAEHLPPSSRKDSSRADKSKQRGPSRPIWPEHPVSKRASSFPHPSGPETMPGYFPSDPSEDSASPEPEPSPTGYRYHRRNLSPIRTSRARRHSHDAYSRRPPREVSPDYYKRYSHDVDPAHPGRWYSPEGPPRGRPWGYKDDLPLPRQPGIKFREYAFDGPSGIPSSPESPIGFQFPPHYVSGPGPGYMFPPRAALDPGDADVGRRRYSGGSLEHSRPHPVPGMNPWGPRWVGPMPGSSKKYMPIMPDMEYRRPMYDR